MTEQTLSNLLHESRRFPPPPELTANANVRADVYAEAEAGRLAFLERQAHRLNWAAPWDQVLDWSSPPFARWFVGGKLNTAVNCLDRHVAAGRGDKVAYYWEGEPGDTRVITYADLKDMVCRAANALTELGVRKGDRVAIYMPMIPETVVAKKDEDGDIWLLGRVDDVMLVSGHNISTTEVESALVSSPKVAEAAVVGAADPVTGQGIVAFVILRGDNPDESVDLGAELRQHVASVLGPIARPRQIMVVPELPKTRSGKIMRRLLRDIADNRQLGDVTTLTDSTVMDLIKAKLPTAKPEE